MNYTKEQWVLICAYSVAIVLLLVVPKHRRREAQAAFLFQGCLNWILGLIVVEAGWIEYPVREFAIAVKTSFLYEYLAYPAAAVYFNLFYPKGKGIPRKIGYYAAYAVGLTIPEAIIERYTGLIDYIGWSWYWTTVSLVITLFISRRFFKWFTRV